MEIVQRQLLKWLLLNTFVMTSFYMAEVNALPVPNQVSEFYQRAFPTNSHPDFFNVLVRDRYKRSASCPVDYERTIPAERIMNDYRICKGERHIRGNQLPFYSINNVFYNNRSVSGNYMIVFMGIYVHTFSTTMNDTCLYCVRGDDQGFSVAPNGIGANTHYQVTACESGCDIPYSEGRGTVTDFHRSGINGDAFEYYPLANTPGCTSGATGFQSMVDLCGDRFWSADSMYVQHSDRLSVSISNGDFPARKRQALLYKKDANDELCALDRTLTSVVPDLTRQVITVAEGEGNDSRVCIDVPSLPEQATQYILATPGQPDGSCSCNLMTSPEETTAATDTLQVAATEAPLSPSRLVSRYLDACSCRTGEPFLQDNNGTLQLCLTNKSNVLNDSVVFMTRDTDAVQDSYTCTNHRAALLPEAYRNNSVHHSLILSEHRINPVQH